MLHSSSSVSPCYNISWFEAKLGALEICVGLPQFLFITWHNLFNHCHTGNPPTLRLVMILVNIVVGYQVVDTRPIALLQA